MNIGQRIKKRRKELNMSAETLADMIGKSASTVYRYEKGDISHVDSDALLPIAQALVTTPAYLMGWDEISNALGSSSPAAQKLRAIGEQFAPHTTTDTTRVELMELYERLNSNGREALLKYARFLNTDPDMKKDGASSDATA